ncbi:MAG: TetR/AcrR family transcriptional regulator [Deltaproteobacteria bacterium]|nr:TetR/AcrR family transcriptional regulator [Deltaproteobacteria bacterium]
MFERRRKREKNVRKGIILKSARRLFFEKGFKSVTVESIAKKAELSKGAVYLHFKSKDEIYTQILLDDIDKFHKRVSGLFGNGSSASAILVRLSDIYVDFFLKDKELFRILMTFMLNANHRNLPEEVENHIIKTTNKTIDIIEKILQYGIETHDFPPTINLRQNRNAIWGLLNGIISLYLFTGSESKREDLIRSTVQTSLEIFIRGLKAS